MLRTSFRAGLFSTRHRQMLSSLSSGRRICTERTNELWLRTTECGSSSCGMAALRTLAMSGELYQTSAVASVYPSPPWASSLTRFTKGATLSAPLNAASGSSDASQTSWRECCLIPKSYKSGPHTTWLSGHWWSGSSSHRGPSPSLPYTDFTASTRFTSVRANWSTEQRYVITHVCIESA